MQVVIYGVPNEEDARILIEDDIQEKLRYYLNDEEATVGFDDEPPQGFAEDDGDMHVLLVLKDFDGEWNSRELNEFYKSANNYFRRFFYDEETETYRLTDINLIKDEQLRK